MRKPFKTRALFTVLVLGILSIITLSVTFTRPANAVVADVVQRWVLAMHYNCVRQYAEPSITPEGTEKITDIMYPDSNRATEPLPSLDYFTDKISSTETGYLTCRQVLEGDGITNNDDISGIFKLMGVNNSTSWRDISGAAGVAEKLGYSSEGGVKITIDEMRYDENGGGDGLRFETSDMLTVTESNGKLDYDISSFSTALLLDDVELELNDSKTKLTITFDPVRGPFDGCSITVGGEVSKTADLSRDNIFVTINNIQTAINEINNTRFAESCENRGPTGDGYQVMGFNTYTLRLSPNIASSGYGLLPDSNAAATQSINKLTNGGSIESNIKLSDEQKYDMYTYYMTHAKNYDASKLDCHNNGGREVFLEVGGQWTKFYLNEHVGDWEEYVTLNDDGTFGRIGIEGIISWLKSYMGSAEFREVGDNETCPTPDIGEQITQTTVDPENSCFSNANSLGWIVCPIITATGDAISTLYESIVQPLLQIKASALDRQSTAYQAWQYFQSIANIIFVILFLVVILSQITGVGIDNLGIKRILPKLIISAVLVNLSYILCMLLVDVSNIAGSGIYSFFNGLSVSPGSSAYSGQAAVNTLLSGLGLGAGGAVLFATAPFWGAAAVPAILLGLVSILISIIVMFVLLGVYQAGVVIAVVVSPIAFVLYMLPNTKSIFDRWRKLFQGLLLLYPLCGLMMGGGAFVGRVIQGVSDGFWMALLGALLSVIPFFFIPAILKSSMSAMGNIGAKISGLGKAASGRATGAIAKSEPFKDWQARRAAGIKGFDKDGTPIYTAAGRRMNKIAQKDTVLGRAAKRRAARGMATYQKREDELKKAESMLDPNNIAAHEVAQRKSVEKEALAAEMALINNETRNGEDEGTLYQMYDEAVAGGNTTRARAIAEIAGRRKDSASRFAEKMKKDTIEGKYAGTEGVEMLRSISKQIATGDNSKNYREGNAGGFEFAARTNDGSNTVYNYADWISNEDNVKRVTDNYLNTPEGLASQTNASLREFSGEAAKDKTTGKVLYQANINKAKDSLAKTAGKYYENQKVGGAYYSDKEENMAKLRDLGDSSIKPNPGNAKPGETLNIQHLPTDHDGSGDH